MINKRFFTLGIIFLCLFSFVNAETMKEGSLKEPNEKRIILVGKVSLKNPIDLKAREAAFCSKGMKALQIGMKQDNFYIINDDNYPENAPDFGETFFYVVKKNKDNTYYINNFTGSIFSTINPWYKFALPAGVKIVVPEDVKYVYIGNFEYDLDYALRVVEFNHYDEYSLAQKELNRAMGKEVDLVRGRISFPEK